MSLPEVEIHNESPASPTLDYFYDGFGRVETVNDLNNYNTGYEYDRLHRVTRVTRPGVTGGSPETEYVYDKAGQVLLMKEKLGTDFYRTTSYLWDGLGRLVREVAPDPDTGDKPNIQGAPQFADPDPTNSQLNPFTRYEYDAAGNLTKIRTPLEYDDQEYEWSFTDTLYVYDPLGRRTKEIDPNGAVTTFAYDLVGNMVALTDPPTATNLTGNTTVWEYDARDRVISETNQLDDARTFTYDTDGHGPKTVTNALGYTTTFDVNGLTTTTRWPVTIDPNTGDPEDIPGYTRETSVIYNAAGLPVEFINADGTKRTIGYRNSDVLGDAGQFPTFIRDESGRERRFTYYGDGRLETASDLAGVKTFFDYDSETLRLETVRLPNGNTVTYGYDGDGRITSIARPGLGTYSVTQFNVDGQPEIIELPSGETVEMTYDPDTNRLDTRQVTLPDDTVSEHVRFHYQAGTDQLERVEDLLAPVDQVTYTYYNDTDNRQEEAPDPSHAGKLEKIVYENGSSIAYKYDALGRVNELTTKPVDTGPESFITTYEYNELGNVWKVWDPFNPQVQTGSVPTVYTYDALGRLATRLLPNGVETTWTFDNRDRLVSIVHFDPDPMSYYILASFTYRYAANSVGEPERIIRRDSAPAASFVDLVYDAALRLKSEAHYEGDPDDFVTDTWLRTISYTYDAAGNRTSRTVENPGEFETEVETDVYRLDSESGYELDKITGADPLAVKADFDYDAGGRMTSLARGTTDAQLAYNANGQLVSFDNETGTDYSYTYDAHGHRTGASDTASNVRNFLVAPAAQRLGAGALDVAVQHLATDGSGGLLNGWVYAGENPILRFDESGDVVYYLCPASDGTGIFLRGR